VLVEPAQTTDDYVEKVVETAPAFSLLASRGTKETEFDQLNLQVYSFAWAIPHLLRTNAQTLADDERGAIVELMKSGVSFRNESTDEITIHANTPVALQKAPDRIYARLSGFFSKSGGGRKTDDIRVKPNETVTYKINWKSLPNEYTPLMEGKDGRLWMNMITFAVETKNINQKTGEAPNALAGMVSMIPKMHYSKRKSNPIVPPGQILTTQDTDNYGLMLLDGADDLFSVYPISVQSGFAQGIGENPLQKYSTDHSIFGSSPGSTSFIQDAAREGDYIGVKPVLVNMARDGGEPRAYTTAGLTVAFRGGAPRPLNLPTRQGWGTRLIIPGFCIPASPGNATVYYSYWKWDTASGFWVLWDDYEQVARYASSDLTNFTPINTYVPILCISGVLGYSEQDEERTELLKLGKNQFGQAYGDPRGFGSFLRKAISVLTIVGQVAGYIGGLL
jgi:hypothetical protein